MKVTTETKCIVELTSDEVFGITSEIDNVFKKHIEQGADPKEIEGLLNLKGNIVVNMNQ